MKNVFFIVALLTVSMFAGAQAINCPSGWNATTGSCGVASTIQTTGYPFAYFGSSTSGVGLSGSNFILQTTTAQHAPISLMFQTPVNVQAFTTTFQFQLDTWNLAFVLNNATHDGGAGPAPPFTLASGFTSGAGSEGGFYQGFGGVGNPPPNNIFVLNIDSGNQLVNNTAPYYNNVQIYQQVQSPSIPDDGQAWFYYSNKVSTSPLQLSNISGTVCTPVLNGSCVPTGGSSTPDTFSATVIYTGTTVTLNMYDVTAGGTCSPVTSGTCFTYSWPNVSIPSWVNGTTAYAGFASSDNANPPNNLVLKSWIYTALSAASAPTFSLAAGTYASAQSITLSGPTGATLCYNTTGAPATDGNGNCLNSTKYTSAISVPKGQTIYAVAGSGSTGYGDSAIGSSAYNITGSAASPIFNQPGGIWQGNQTVQLTTAHGGVICYNTSGSPTTNGSTGCTTGTLYSAPITVSSNQTLYAVAGGTGYTDSAVGSAAYVISPFATVSGNFGSSPANSPTFSPAPGTYSAAQSVTLASTTSGANICYVLASSPPSLLPATDNLGGCAVGTLYTGAISVASNQTLYAIAGTTIGNQVAGTGSSSSVAQGYYFITPTTWYVNSVGGTRYSVNETSGQCNGKNPQSYAAAGGTGVNLNCAFGDIRSLWTDASYTTNPSAGAPAWGWIGQGGDTYLIDCSGGTACRIGQTNATTPYGLYGNNTAAGAPSPPSGTAANRTEIYGINYASCQSPSAKAHVNGGYGVGAVFSLSNVQYVDFACFDITDFSSCGLAGQTNTCTTSGSGLSDFASNGIETQNTTTNTTITDVYVHGMAKAGHLGATGTGVVFARYYVSGNASAGFNFDDSSGQTLTGTLNMNYVGCAAAGFAEVYPITTYISMPGFPGNQIGTVGDGTDDNHSGYGDCYGTASVSSSPAAIVTVTHSIAAYATQDGFDLLHLQGGGTTLDISQSLAYGNMGQQLKVGAAGSAVNNVLVGNCNALRQSIPGFASGFNTNLSDYCRAADTAVYMSVSDGSTTKYQFNTLYTASAVALEIAANGTCTTTCYLQYNNNVLVGFTNNTTNGYPAGGTGNNPNPIYFDNTNILTASGSSYTHNATYGQLASYPCPDTSSGETNAICTSPGLTDQTWHLYGYGTMTPASGAAVIGAGVAISGITTDYAGNLRANPPTIGAYEYFVSGGGNFISGSLVK